MRWTRVLGTSVVAVVVGAGVDGCAKRVVQPPPAAFVSLVGQRAAYRDWSRLPDVCLVDPAVLQGDLDGMSALLQTYLEKTAPRADGSLDEGQLDTVERAEVVLPVALTLEVQAVEAAKKSGCTFTGLDKALDLNRKAADRVKSQTGVGPQLRARLALQRWKDGLPDAQAQAKTKVCDAKPKAPAVYFATQDEKGLAAWSFCDGAVVTGAVGSPPALTTKPTEAAPPPPKKGKKAPPPPALDAKAYVDAAAAWPSADVSRAPAQPSGAPKKKDDGAAEPKDG